MNIKVGKITGINTDLKAAIAISLPGEEGSFFLGVLQLECDDAFTRGRQLLSEVGDNYFASSEGTLERLSEAAATVKSKLSDTENLSFLLAGFSGKALYLVGQGEVLAWLRRDGAISYLDISSGQVISGFLEEGNKVFLSTKSLADFLGDSWEEEEIGEKVRNSETPCQAGLVLEVEGPAGEVISADESKMTELEANPQPSLSVEGGQNILRYLIGKTLSKLKGVFPRSGRSRLILAVCLILILGAGVGYQYKVRQDAERNRQFGEFIQSAKLEFDNAKGLANLDPPAAKDKLSKAKDSLSKALALKPSDQEALGLKKQIEGEEGSILQQFNLSNLPVFLDLGLVKDGFQAQKMSLSDGKLLLLDTGSKTLVSVDMAKKSNQILAGKDTLGDAQFGSINGDAIFIYSSDKGILKVGLNDKKTMVVSKKDDDWGKIVDIAGFAGNVYLLDSGQVWKYLVTSSGYGDKREYLSSGVKADFGSALRMQIESSIYILKQGGEILRFTKGAADNFSLGGLDKGIKDPKSIFISSDTDNLYVLDSGNSRFVVLTKTGAYKSQYQAGEFGEASDLVVDEKGKKVYLLIGSKIYSMDLK